MWRIQTQTRSRGRYVAAVWTTPGSRGPSVSLGYMDEDDIKSIRAGAHLVGPPPVDRQEFLNLVALPPQEELVDDTMLYQRWVEERCAPHRRATRPGSWRRERQLLDALVEHLGHLQLRNLTALRWVRFLEGQHTWSPRTKALAKNTYVQTLKYAVDCGVLTQVHPMPRVAGGTTRARTPEPLDAQELELLLAQAPTPMHRCLWTVATWQALRPSEATGLRWEDIDLDQGLMRVRGTKTREADRVVPLLPRALESLVSFHEGQELGLVFTWKNKPIGSWHQALKRAADRSGIEGGARRVYGPYLLRHTGATLWAFSGIPKDAARHLMGHHTQSRVLEESYERLKPTQIQQMVLVALKRGTS